MSDNRYFRPDGSNLVSILYYLRKKHRISYNLVQKTVRLVAPFFEDFVLNPLALNPDMIALQWRQKGSDEYFDMAHFSDGSLRFIALATLLLQPEILCPSVTLIDEPELGLHPFAITILASLIKRASVHTQIIVATQSSLLLDHFEPEDVIVTNRINGQTEFKRLNREAPDTWLEDYSLGELWEKNEFGGRPSPELTFHELVE